MKLSVVTTLYYSEKFIQEFYGRLIAAIGKITSDYEIIFVNDGSPDQSKQEVLKLQSIDSSIILVDLSRNFGHHKAIMTGLTFCTGDHVFLIDADLEEAPELLSLFWEELHAIPSFDVVYGIQNKRKGDFFERVSGHIYYNLLSRFIDSPYPSNTLTSRIMTRSYIEGLKKFSEKEFDIWGLFVLNGFRQRGILVTKGSKGSSTYTLKRKIRMAVATITTLTSKPLFLIPVAGSVIMFIALIYSLYIVCQYFAYGLLNIQAIMLASVWFIGGAIMLSLGIISIYLSKMYWELKGRPVSIVKSVYRIEKA